MLILRLELFRAVKLTKIVYSDNHKYSAYSIGIVFDAHASILLSESGFRFSSGFCKNVIVFGADMCSSVHIDNKEKDILIFGKSPTDGLDDTNEVNSYIIVNDV